MRIIIFFVFLLLPGISISQQPYKFLHLQQQDGLPSNTVYRAAIDSKGNLWFTTDMGVAIFNGSSFVRYNSYSGLPDNEIFFCHEDINQRMWMGSFSGELSFFQNGTIHNTSNTPFLRLPFKASINSLFQEKDSSLTLTFSNEKFARIFRDQVKVFDIPYPNVQMVRQRTKNLYDLYCMDRVVTIDTLGNTVAEKKFPPDMISNGVLSFGTDGTIIPCLYGNKGIFDYNGKLLYPIRISAEQVNFLPYIQVKDKNIFMCTRNGLIANNELLLKGITVTNIIADRAGNYWISTLANGVYCMYNDFKNILEYPLQLESPVTEVKTVGQKTLLSTYSGGLYEFDKQNGNTRYLGGELKTKGLLTMSKITDNGSYFLFTTTGNYSILSHSGKLLKFPNLYEVVPPKKVLIKGNRIFVFFISEILAFPIVNDRVNLNERILFSEKSRIFHRVADPKSDDIWYSTADGVSRVSNDKRIFQNKLPKVTFRSFDIFNDYFLGYTEKNEIYISNRFRSDPQITKLKNMGFILDKIYKVDSMEAIISTSENYLHLKFNSAPGKPDFTLTVIENPFIPRRVDYIFSDTGFLYFFKGNKVTKVARSIITKGVTPPSIYFSFVKSGSLTIPVKDEVRLAYKDARNVSIKFNSICDFGSKVECEYRILNKSGDWAILQTEELNLVSLTYGSYVINVRSKTLSGLYSNTASFTLIIDRPYWATWWFALLLVIAISVLLAVCIKLYLKRIIARQKKKRDIEIQHQQLEFKALNALMNPHFIFNSLNNIQGLINENEKEAANRYLVVFSKVIRQNMINLTEISISLQKEINLIENYLQLEKLRFGQEINYKIEIDETVDIDHILIPPLIIQPLVENAVKHGIMKHPGCGNKIWISIKKEEDGIAIQVEDDGIGFLQGQKKKDHVSLGVKNIQERLAYFQKYNQRVITCDIKELVDDNGHIAGTRATVKVKF
jgi:two-component sensor histidine kinase